MLQDNSSRQNPASDSHTQSGMTVLRSFWLAIPFLAALFLLILIAKNGVNVPFGDEWTIPGQFLVQERHSFADFFAQSNESRLIFPKLIFFITSKFLGWPPKHYMYFGWCIVVSITALTYILCYRPLASRRKPDAITTACIALTSLLFLSPAAYENWLWGLQWVIFVPLLCTLIAFCLQVRTQSFSTRYFGTVLLNTIAMFSFSNGMLLWVLCFPFWKEGLAFLARKRGSQARMLRTFIWSLIYLVTAAILIAAYFKGYQRNPAHPSVAYALQQPWNTLKYFWAWCGGALHGNAAMHLILGLLTVLVSLFFLVHIVLKLRNEPGNKTYYHVRMLYPSLLILTYAFGSGLVTTSGRAGFGIEQAYSSRYLFHSGAMTIGLIAMLNAHRVASFRTGKGSFNFSNIFAGVTLVLLILAFRTWNHGYKMFELMRLSRTQDLLTVRLLDLAPTSPLVDRVSAGTDLPALVKSLEDKHIYDSSKFGPWILDALRTPPLESEGRVSFNTESTTEVAITGWGMIPGQYRPADSILICRSRQGDNSEPWMMLAVGRTRKDVVQTTGHASLLKSGFLEAFFWKAGNPLPTTDAFVVDETNRRLYRISQQP